MKVNIVLGMDKVVIYEKVLVSGYFNRNVGSDMGGFREVHDGFGEVHGDFEIGKINDGYTGPSHNLTGVRLLHWTVAKGLHLMNTCFQKRKTWLTTFRS